MGYVATWIDNLMIKRKLSPATKAVLKAIADDPERASYCSAAQLALVVDVNVATVVRAAQAIGFSGWSELSTEVRNRYLSSLEAHQHFERNSRSPTGSALSSLTKDLELMRLLSETLTEELVDRVVSIIAGSRSTHILATGAYAAPGNLLAHNAQGLGFHVTLGTGSITSMINEVRLLQPGDTLLTFSIWKTSASIGQLCEIAKERGITLIVIADQHSHLAELADELILVPSEGVGPMASVTCAVSVVQCIISGLAGIDRGRTAAMLEELQGLWSRTNAVVSD